MLIGRGSAAPGAAGKRRVAVTVKLNKVGRRLLETHLGGFRTTARIAATTVEGAKLRTKRAARLTPTKQLVVPTLTADRHPR